MSSKRPSKLADNYRLEVDINAVTHAPVCDPSADLNHISVFHTQSDAEYVQCPHCHYGAHDHKFVGTIHISGNVRDLMACSSCSKLFDFVPDSVKAYVDQVKSACGVDNVTFSSAKSVTSSDENNITYILGGKLDSLSQNLTNLIEDLTFKVEQQAQELNELKTDPLRKIKETINAFDLK